MTAEPNVLIPNMKGSQGCMSSRRSRYLLIGSFVPIPDIVLQLTFSCCQYYCLESFYLHKLLMDVSFAGFKGIETML